MTIERRQGDGADILQTLTDEHAEILDLMNRLIEKNRAGVTRIRRELFPTLRARIRSFAVAEDLDFFLPLTAYARLAQAAEAAIAEHRQIEELLQSLETDEIDPEEWQRAFADLRDQLTVQFLRAETQLFPAVRSIVKPRERRTLDESFRESRQRLLEN